MTELQERHHLITDTEKVVAMMAHLHDKLEDIATALDDDIFAIDMWGNDPNGANGIITTQPGAGSPIFRNYNGPYVIETIAASWGEQAAQSVSATSTTATPAVNAVLASVTPGFVGLWQIEWTIEVQAAAATQLNAQKLVGFTPGTPTLAMSVQPIAVGTYPQQPIFVNVTAVGQSIAIVQTATEATATITASITAVPINVANNVSATLALGPRLFQMGTSGFWNPQGLHIQMERDDQVVMKLSSAQPCMLEINGHIDRRIVEMRLRK